MQIALTSILDVDRACQHIRGLNLKFPWMLVIERRRKRRSLPQNEYYWKAIITLIATETGGDKQKIHEFFKDKFCPATEVTLGPETRWIKSTTLLGQDTEFPLYCEECIRWAAEWLGISFPTKDEALANDNAPSTAIPFRRAA